MPYTSIALLGYLVGFVLFPILGGPPVRSMFVASMLTNAVFICILRSDIMPFTDILLPNLMAIVGVITSTLCVDLARQRHTVGLPAVLYPHPPRYYVLRVGVSLAVIGGAVLSIVVDTTAVYIVDLIAEAIGFVVLLALAKDWVKVMGFPRAPPGELVDSAIVTHEYTPLSESEYEAAQEYDEEGKPKYAAIMGDFVTSLAPHYRWAWPIMGVVVLYARLVHFIEYVKPSTSSAWPVITIIAHGLIMLFNLYLWSLPRGDAQDEASKVSTPPVVKK